MAWIKTIDEDDATGVVKKYYDGNKRSWGGVDNIIKAHSSEPVGACGHS